MFLPISFVLTRDKVEGDSKAWFAQSIREQLDSEIARQNNTLPISQKYRWETVLPAETVDMIGPALNDSLWWFLRTNRLVCMGMEVTPVFIFDQFEEVLKLEEVSFIEGFFSLCQDLARKEMPEDVRERMALLPEMPDIDYFQNYHTLLSMREEYIGQLDYWGQQRFFIPSMKNNRYSLRPLTLRQAETIITGQGVDTLNNVKDLIIAQAKENNRDTISTLILSVLCYKLLS